jgi:hypothetical protein
MIYQQFNAVPTCFDLEIFRNSKSGSSKLNLLDILTNFKAITPDNAPNPQMPSN